METTFKVGDKVQAPNRGRLYDSECVVSRIGKDFVYIRSTGSNYDAGFYPKNLRLIEAAAPPLVFKSGDKVRVTRKAKDHENGWQNPWVPEMDLAVGKIGTVVRVTPYLKHNVEIKFQDVPGLEYTWGYPDFVLEKVEEQPQFKVGDRVQVKYGYGWDGPGTVVRIDHECIVVKLDHKECEGGFLPKKLTKIDSTAVVTPVKYQTVFATAKNLAITLGKQTGVVSADQVQDELAKLGYKSTDLGNAAGNLFRNKNWKKVATTKSVRKGNHLREINKWQYIGA